VLVKTINRKIFVRGQLWVIAQNGSVALINSHTEITLIKTTASKIHVAIDGQKLGAAEYVSLPPFVERLLHSGAAEKRTREVTVVASRDEAGRILASTPGARLWGLEGKKAVITIPI
jgi:L-lactate utilization protein LutB